MRRIEIAGPGAHDGMVLEVPDRVVALVVVTEEDDGSAYGASLSVCRDAGVDLDDVLDLVAGVVLGADAR